MKCIPKRNLKSFVDSMGPLIVNIKDDQIDTCSNKLPTNKVILANGHIFHPFSHEFKIKINFLIVNFKVQLIIILITSNKTNIGNETMICTRP